MSMNYTLGCDDEKEGAGRGLKETVARRLFNQRILMYSEVVTRQSAQMLISQLICLASEAPDKPVRLLVNSPGGDADSGMAVYDVLKFIKTPVDIICTGLAASAAVCILLGAPKQRRFSLKHTRIMIHQPSSGAHGDATDLQIEAAEIIKCRKTINDLIARETGQSADKVEADVKRNFWMSAEEALAYGLVGKILSNQAELGI